MRRVALTGAAVALVLSLAGVVAISAASQAAEPGTHKARTLTFAVVFSTGQSVAIAGPAPRELALTGGTGSYRNAGGEGIPVEFGNGRGRMTLQVLSWASSGRGA